MAKIYKVFPSTADTQNCHSSQYIAHNGRLITEKGFVNFKKKFLFFFFSLF